VYYHNPKYQIREHHCVVREVGDLCCICNFYAIYLLFAFYKLFTLFILSGTKAKDRRTLLNGFWVSMSLGASVTYLRELMCDLSILWLTWAIAQIVAINLVFYGIKSIRWRFFLPHLILRFFGTGALLCLIVIFGLSIVSEENNAAYIAGLVIVTLLVVFWIYSTVTEFWCAYFVKRSQETGFSISVARPIGPATISLSERAAPLSPPKRQLPPLRHTYGGRSDPQKYAQ
ncbi:unnamed protein product, partial [Angiostrongylus costaricensis]|uniref:XK-related protein n=1 Tax=Angiostrongylus costaricensis TaxID=334426 RepID=A0A0R3PUB8_ANGCS